ncbi:MAG: hypothetical protein RO009_20795 [Pseudorhodoplanes sp.]|jgi:hypothetical protein|nr:hypothetical protein [Pseudorhodoplanes sp.]
MKFRPPHEPTRDFHPSHRLHDDAARNPRSLGCRGCPDLDQCGGLHTDAGIFDCGDLCSCADRSKCDMVCRRKPHAFFERLQEVEGFDLATIPRVAPVARPPFPDLVPLIDHKYSRTKTLGEAVVAVPLYALFHMGTGEPLVRTRAELAGRFLIPESAKVIASGVARDVKVEAWWAFAGRARVMQTLRDLGIALVTVPNFSLFVNVPRPDNLHGIKRIGLSWAELMAGGIPAALHLNARTDFDYQRWTRFIAERPEVECVAFEFGTGAGYTGRIDWHVERLCALARSVGRPLTLVVRGGVQMLPRLRACFGQVVLIESDAFSRALKRRRAVITEAGRLRWTRMRTPNGAPIDDLLMHNIATVRAAHGLRRAAVSTPSRAALPPSRRSAQHADRHPAQMSFVAQLDMTLQARVVAPDRQRMVVTAKA